MSIRWDPLLARHVAAELNAELTGARLRAVRLDGRERDLVLFFRDRTLLWRLHPNRAFPIFREVVEPEEGDLNLKARLRKVYAPLDERIIVFEFMGERRDQGPVEVVIELLGNQLNGIVIEGKSRTIRHVLTRRTGRRPALVGAGYQSPPPTRRIGSDGTLSRERWDKLMSGHPPDERATELTRRIAWTSPLNAEAFLLQDGHALWSATASGSALSRPVLLETAKGSQPYPFTLPEYEAHEVGTLLEAFALCAQAGEDEGDAAPSLSIGPELIRALADEVAHHERRVRRLQGEFDGRVDPVELRLLGDLILSRYAEISNGSTEVTLDDFDGEKVSIELDPSLAPHENAALRYDRAVRSERAAKRLPALIKQATVDRDRAALFLEKARAGEVDAELVRASLPRFSGRPHRGNLPPSLPYRTFRSSGGLEIRVGRGARHNDDLTFRHSAPDDIWLHARHMAGAHVILRWHGPGSPPMKDLEEAGILAALHSKARTSGSVPVDWTARKHVRKPRRSAPGAVVPDRVKTVFVAPDPSLLVSLADQS